MKHLITVFVVAAAATAVAQDVHAQNPVLSRDWVVKTEATSDLNVVLGSLALRRGFIPLKIADYARFYRTTTTNERVVVEAVFTTPSPLIVWLNGVAVSPSADEVRLSRPGIFLDEYLPIIDDGGCSVVKLSFDYATRRLLTARCND